MFTKILSFAVALTCAVPAFKSEPQADFIKWVDCAVSAAAMEKALSVCREAAEYGRETAFSDVVAYVAAKNGNRFGSKDAKLFDRLRKELRAGKTVDEAAGDNKYYRYHKEAYAAVFGNMVGAVGENGKKTTGVLGRFPLAAGHWFSHYDDFGNARSYGFKRKHLGHDIMGSVGTPIVAVEGGTVTELGWNRYGGWRIGIRSDDGLRYWYYAHLKRNNPYARGLAKGARVQTGEHIGYLGQTGYSVVENTNLKTGSPHLHIGLQLIFDESQEKGSKEIWVDLYGITQFLSTRRVKLVKNDDGDLVCA